MTPRAVTRVQKSPVSQAAKQSIVFIEAWINPIYVRFANEFAKQHPSWQVYYITDSDAIKPGALDTVSKDVTLIGLKNAKYVRRMLYPFLYLGSFVSKSMARRYADTLYLHTFPDLSRTLARIKPQIIQSNVLAMPYTWQAAKYARVHRVPFILRTEERAPHGLHNRIGLNALLILFKRVVRDAVLVLPWTTQSLAFAEEQLQVPKHRIALLPAGVDITLFKPTQRTVGRTVRLLTVQRFVPYKDYPTLLGGLRLALDAGFKGTLTIVGEGPDEALVHDLVRELRLSGAVTFRAPGPYTSMPKLYAAHDVLVHTGRNETIGMVVPEAMACGLMPIVCDSAGAVTYLTPETGIIFATSDAQALAKKLCTVNAKLAAAAGARAAKHIKKHYTVPATVRAYAKLLQARGNVRL